MNVSVAASNFSLSLSLSCLVKFEASTEGSTAILSTDLELIRKTVGRVVGTIVKNFSPRVVYCVTLHKIALISSMTRCIHKLGISLTMFDKNIILLLFIRHDICASKHLINGCKVGSQGRPSFIYHKCPNTAGWSTLGCSGSIRQNNR